MRTELRRSIWSRLVALSFIVLIVLGNIWAALLMVNEPAPEWLYVSFMVGVGSAALFALMVTLQAGLHAAKVYLRPDDGSADEGEGE